MQNEKIFAYVRKKLYICSLIRVRMRKTLYILTILLACCGSATADVLSNILKGDYAPKTLSVAEQDSILAPASTMRYRLSHKDEKKLYRHSFEANYSVYDTLRRVSKPLADTLIRDAVVSPCGKYVAYGRGADLYLAKLDYGTSVAVAVNTMRYSDDLSVAPVRTQYFNGVTDWLYEEEFGVTNIVSFSPDSRYLAFVRLDETEVAELEGIRYPRAGAANPKAEVWVYDIFNKSLRMINLPAMDEAYLPRLRWTNAVEGKQKQESELVVLRLNRDQNLEEVYYCNPKSLVARQWYREQSRDCYIDYALFDEWVWLSDNSVIVLSEKNGWRQAFLYNQQGKEVKALTKTGVDVTALYGYDEKAGLLYYQQADTPETRHVYALNTKKNTTTRLTTEEGMNSMRFSDDFTRAIGCYESCTTPNRYTEYRVRGEKIEKTRVLLDNDALAAEWQGLGLPEKRFFTFATERGDTLHGWVLMPKGAAKACPTILTQYSGPDSQRVLNRWRRTWDYALAEMGYVVVCVDGRGTGARGRAWRNASYMNLGAVEAEDQIAAARYVATWPEVDAERMAMVGWSYGGFQVLTTMALAGHPFKAGIAIAPVTDWRLYDSAYTERYMRRPQVNERGYEAASLLGKAGQIEGALLLVHGLADDNVHAVNTLELSEALVQAGKQFDEQLYVDDNHQLRRRANYEHLHRRLLRFLKANL